MKIRIIRCLAVFLCIILLSGCNEKTENTESELSNESFEEESSEISENSQHIVPPGIVVPESSEVRIPKKATAEDLAKLQDYEKNTS